MKKHPPDGAAARARTLRQNMTEAEIRVWRMLRAHRMNGYKFRRQVPIGRYIADFVCHEARLVVEIDGGQHDHSSLRETERSGFLQSQGYRILRFWNNEVLANPDGIHQTIINALAASAPLHRPPSSRAIAVKPSPSMGEGWEGVIVPEDNPFGTAGGEFTPTPPSPSKGEGVDKPYPIKGEGVLADAPPKH